MDWEVFFTIVITIIGWVFYLFSQYNVHLWKERYRNFEKYHHEEIEKYKILINKITSDEM